MTAALMRSRRSRGVAVRLRASNPYTAVATMATRSPRLAFVIAGTMFSMFGMVFLIAISSIQAFLMISQQSATNSRATFAPVPRFDDVGLVGDAAVALAAGGIDLVTGGTVGALVPNLPGQATPGATDPGATGPGEGVPGETAPVTPVAATPPATGAPTAPVTADEVVSVYGIRVHTSIADNIRALIDAAAADGIVLSGWGWRDNATQIRLRREHCGTSEYAIYRMPSSQCQPPTARPGASQHERGLAVDFTYNGGSISNRSNAGFQWLQANAAAYGLKNLASEPWHWSTTGR